MRIAGDLTGTPLLKSAVDGGAKAVRAFAEEAEFQPVAGSDARVLELAIVGGGVAGIRAAIEAKRLGLRKAR